MTATDGPTTLEAPAKLTLELRVTGVRADGYHLIDAEMVTLEVADSVTIDPGGHGVSFTGRYGVGIPHDGTDLVSRALHLANRQAQVSVHKRIPAGGGLGGGSADAAAVLRWAGFHDLEAASRLGADIPFCLVGGRARVRGIGEIIDPLPFIETDITLVVPPLAVSTPAVYRAWDDLGGPRSHGPNDLEPAALVVEPQLATWRDRIRDATGAAPVLAGSGATWFVLGAQPALQEALPDAHVVITRTRRQG
jgi:4-diphosphocytidyl-2-C-methyl-D-erythritol kinase